MCPQIIDKYPGTTGPIASLQARRSIEALEHGKKGPLFERKVTLGDNFAIHPMFNSIRYFYCSSVKFASPLSHEL